MISLADFMKVKKQVEELSKQFQMLYNMVTKRALTDADKIRGITVVTDDPTDGQSLVYDAALGRYKPGGVSMADGWINLGLSATYVSATSFTVPGDYTAYFKLGAKIRLVNSTTKYGYVLSSSYSAPNTTVNLVANTSHALASAAITDLRLSYANPPDFPAYLTWTPTVTYSGGTTDPTSLTVTATFAINGRVAALNINGYLTRGSGNRTGMAFSMPITIAQDVTGSYNIAFNGVINCPNYISGGNWTIAIGGMTSDGYHRGLLTYRI